MHWDSFVYTGVFCPDSLAQHALSSAYNKGTAFALVASFLPLWEC